MYRCESWTIKKAEHQKIDAFELWWWRRLLRVPWTARRSNQSILKEINPEYSLEELMLKLQYFGHPTQRADSLENTLMLGKIESRRRGRQRVRWLDGTRMQWTWVWVGSWSWWWTGKPGVLKSTGSQRVRHDWVTELNWTEFFHKNVHLLRTHPLTPSHTHTHTHTHTRARTHTHTHTDRGKSLLVSELIDWNFKFGSFILKIWQNGIHSALLGCIFP